MNDNEALYDYHNSPGPDYDWFSICSRHQKRDDECDLCRRGCWVHLPTLEESHKLFESDYKEWYRQNNNGQEPSESTLKEMKKMFPNININT